MAEKLFEGSISISRPHGPEPPYIEISIVDEMSSSEFVSARIPLKDFAEVVTGLACVPCKFEFRPMLVGKKREHKEEVVLFKGSYLGDESARKKATAKALKPFEVNGWKGHEEDLFNHHRGGQGSYRVRFVRYVDVNDEP
jgi:hypothetical protein